MDWLAALAVVVVFVGVILVHTLWTNRRPRELGRLVERRRVIVNMTTGSAVEGVVWSSDGGWLVLKAAKLLEQRGPAPIDGEVVLEVSKVEFIQRLPAAAE